jgi:hypothetical protein
MKTIEQKQIRFLQRYIGLLTLAIIVLTILLIRLGYSKWHFGEIDAERINIVENNGGLRMVISNQKKQHPGAIKGKIFGPRERPAGMIFFNDEGDECGGLVFEGAQKGANMTYSVDQFNNDQVMQLSYDQEKNPGQPTRSYGLKIWDRNDQLPLSELVRINDSLKALGDSNLYRLTFQKLQDEGLLGSDRLFLGKTSGKKVGLFIKDNLGRPRIEISVDSSNRLLIQTQDSTGHIFSLTP